jgi:APA family basic amino acid/polyamine antiporter
MYLGNFFNNSILSEMWVQKIIAAGIIFIFGMMHIIGVKRGSIIQNILTVLKLGIVFLLIAAGFYAADWGQAGRLSADYASKGNNVVEYGFALLIIMFAYSGWNGATYIAGEVKNPERNLPRALVISSVAIVAIYFALNVIFILATPGEELMKTNAVGAVAVQNLFSGSVFSWEISSLFTLCIVLILLSSVSVQLMVGPRVYYAMAKDRMIFQSLSKIHPKLQTPYLAIILQMFIAIIYVFIGRDSIAALLGYMGFSLGIFPLLTVIGMVYMRYKNPGMNRTYKVPFFPLVPAIYIILTLLMMIGSLFTWTKTSLIAIAVVMIGIPIFYIWQHIVKSKS